VTVAGPLTRVWGFVRSRRLALWLLIFVMVYSFVATVVPQADREPEKARTWGAKYAVAEAVARPLGLHDAYRAPLFLGVMALLFVSTSACAWERTRVSWRLFQGSKGLSEPEIERLGSSPHMRVPVRRGLDRADAFAAARSGLARIGLRLRAGARVGEAVGGRWGLLGSPGFHIALALLFLVIGLGQLTRVEGLIGVPVGYPVADGDPGYGTRDVGPWRGQGASGLTIGASDFRLRFVADDVDRGASAVITLTRGGVELARQRVYPNNPLRFGTIMIHQNDFGLAAALRVEEASGTVLTETRILTDFDPSRPSGTTEGQFRVSGLAPEAASLGVLVTIQADHDGAAVLRRLPKERRALVTVTGPASYRSEAALAPGDALVLPGGQLLRLVDIVYYARLSVVDDWSVYPIYALFVLAGVAVSVAVFTPYRVVRLLLVETPDGLVLHAQARHARRDPLFRERVEDALRAAVGPEATVTADAGSSPSDRHDTESGKGSDA